MLLTLREEVEKMKLFFDEAEFSGGGLRSQTRCPYLNIALL